MCDIEAAAFPAPEDIFATMHSTSQVIALLGCVMGGFATVPAALSGPAYPAPRDLSSNGSAVAAAWANFTETIDSYITQKGTVEGLLGNLGGYTFSVGSFSLHDPNATSLQYHHTGETVANSSQGVKEVNGESIYRIASISKVFTVYLILLEVGTNYWDEPITNFVPGLNATSNASLKDPINSIDWAGVTLGALAGQMGGIPHAGDLENADYLITLSEGQISPEDFGLPPLNESADSLPCAAAEKASPLNVSCPENQFVQGLQRPPSFSPWTTPAYSDAAFALLGFALENITGRSLDDMFGKDILEPLEMHSTTLHPPSNYSHSVIPTGVESIFSIVDEDYRTSGGFYSTPNDLAKFGLSILNSTLLLPEETRQWLKPITHTGSLQQSVGRPWEIYRIVQPSNGRVTDLYAKEGDSPPYYSAYLILAPDYDTGFTIQVAGSSGLAAYANNIIADLLTSTMIASLEVQAAAEATHNLAGTYSAPDTLNINSSMSLAVNMSLGSGLFITSWIMNGTDVLEAQAEYGPGDIITLFPTNLISISDGSVHTQRAFRSVASSTVFLPTFGPFLSQVTTRIGWEDIDSQAYGSIALDQFIFTLDANGNATAVTPTAWRITLDRVAL